MPMCQMPSPPDLPCQCYSQRVADEIGCVCEDTERALRGWSNGRTDMPPMTAAQRQWCVEEIRSASDATPQPDEAELAAWQDRDYASGTLIAWQDFAYDKGLI